MRRLRSGQAAGLRAALLLASAFGLAGCVVLVHLLRGAALQPTASAHDAVLVFTCCFLLLHGALSAITAALQAWRIHVEHVSIDAPYEPGVVLMLWMFTAAAAALAWAAMSLLPQLIGG